MFEDFVQPHQINLEEVHLFTTSPSSELIKH